MSAPVLIGLAGYAGSGKSTVATMLYEEHGFARARFAGPLKAMMAALLKDSGADDETIHELIEGANKNHPSIWLNGISPRVAMQTLGTEWGRVLMGEDFWIELAARKIERFRRRYPSVPMVFEDVRFVNEADLIRAKGGIVLRVDRPGTGPVNTHASDAPALAIDGRIVNDGPLSVLAARVDGLARRASEMVCKTAVSL